MKDGYCENCLNPAECYLTGCCWPPTAKEKADDRLAPTAGSPSSDTPETDALRQKLWGKGWSDSYMTMMSHANKLERERDAAKRMWSIHQDKLAELREQVRLTIMENLHLADGDVCTLKRLKDAIGFELPLENTTAQPPR